MFDIGLLQELIRSFIGDSISVDEFSAEYTRTFSAVEAGEIDKDLFLIMEDLFEDIDSYSPLWTADDEAKYPYRITEATLRVEARTSLRKLEEYIAKRSP